MRARLLFRDLILPLTLGTSFDSSLTLPESYLTPQGSGAGLGMQSGILLADLFVLFLRIS